MADNVQLRREVLFNMNTRRMLRAATALATVCAAAALPTVAVAMLPGKLGEREA
jgi:hypothetical protein